MSTSKEIVVQDACVLFDLIDLGLIHSFFEMDLTVMTTQQVITEIEDGDQLSLVNEFIVTGRLSIDDTGELDEIRRIIGENSGLSFADGSVLELALRRKGTVLSSDLKLRNATVRNSLTVRGVLWIIVELQACNLLSTAMAIEKLHLYGRINDRAPRVEIKALIEKFSKGSPPK